MPLGPAAMVYEYAVSHSPLKETPARQRWAKALRIADPCRASPNPLAVAYIQGSRSLVHTLHVNDLATCLSLTFPAKAHAGACSTDSQVVRECEARLIFSWTMTPL